MPVGLALLLATAGAVQAAAGDPAAPVLAPGWEPLRYPAPAPGTYDLPPLGAAADGHVLDVDGQPCRLHDFLGDKVVLLSFIYTSCPDMSGCPLATYVLARVQKRLSEDPALGRAVRLVTLSFDPARDRPQVMREYGATSPARAPTGASSPPTPRSRWRRCCAPTGKPSAGTRTRAASRSARSHTSCAST